MRLDRNIIYLRKSRCQGKLGIGNAELFGSWETEDGKNELKKIYVCQNTLNLQSKNRLERAG